MSAFADLLVAGEDPTFSKVAKAAGIPERTVYRYFPSRKDLMSGVFDWANERIGFDGQLPTNGAESEALARRVFPGFDEIAPIVHELLIAPEGRSARLAHNARRQEAALAVVHHEVPGLDDVSSRRVAAVLQLLTTAGAWQSFRDYWDMDGAEAAEAAALAIRLLLAGARTGAEPTS